MFDWWWEFLYNISHAILQCIDALSDLFFFFAGAADADINSKFTGDASANPLQSIFSTNTVAIWFAGFLGLALLVFMISIIIAMVRTEFVGKDNREGKVKILKSCIKGTLLVVLLPAIFGIGIRAVTILLSGISSAMSTDTNTSFASNLFNICMPDNTNTYNWDSSYSEISSLLDTANVQNGTNYSMQDFNWFIAYIGGLILLFILGLAVLNLIERIIDLVFLYIISPIIIAVSPLDEGNRLGIWKDLTISKFFSIAGMIICFYIYFLFMGIINSILVGDTFLIGFAKLICAIGGALAARKGGLLISNLVGHNTALIEGQQQGLAAQAVGTGFRAGLGLITSLGHSAVHLLGRGASSIGGAMGGIGGIGGNVAATAADTASAAVAPTVAAATINSAATTFSALSSTYQSSGRAVSASMPIPSNSTFETAGAVLNTAASTVQGVGYTGERVTLSPPAGTAAASDNVSVAKDISVTMPPVSSEIKNMLNSAEGFGSSSDTTKENK